jgi:cholesterol oxidase
VSSSVARCRLSFTEEMKGFFAFGEADYERGFERGRAAGWGLMFRLTIVIDDTYAFVADPAHLATATGFITSDALGGTCPVERGEFNLFMDAGEVNGEPARHMRYRLWFRDAAGHPLTLSGVKEISHPAAASRLADVWRETTTLYARLSSGWVDENISAAGRTDSVDSTDPVDSTDSVPERTDQARLVGAGILHLQPLDFARQLSTFRVAGPDVRDRAQALVAFGRLFVGQLWEVFRTRRSVPAAR